MRYINVPCVVNGKEELRLEKIYEINELGVEDLLNCEVVSKKQGKHKIEYINSPITFDIEAYTPEPPKDENGDYLYKPYAFMYQWQACILGRVCFGRTWEEFCDLLYVLRSTLELNSTRRAVIYVHSLPYEFQFIKDFLKVEEMFAKEKRNPLRFLSDGLEFRCSYALSNRSLSSFCENSSNCIHFKLSGDDFDYRKERTPFTPLTEKEEGYCYNDVAGLYECILSLMDEDDLSTIPMTNTGYVRREFRQAMNTKELRRLFLKTRLTVEQYQLLRRAFRGGNTHANRFLAGLILKNVHSYDESSAYPACMAMDLFPMGKFTNVTLDTQEKLDYYTKNYCVVMDVEFYNVVLKDNIPVPYMDLAHCRHETEVLNDNGRVLEASYVEMSLTEIDLEIIREQYDMEGFRVTHAMYAERGHLPDEFIKKMMEFFEAKTQLKDVEGREYDYAKGKNRLNSSFGMTVTDLAHDEIIFNPELEEEWDKNDCDLEKGLNDFYDSRNNFLSYQWGVYVTANARRRLQKMIDKVGMDLVYCDTDSIKFINDEHIKEFEELNKKLIKQAEENHIPAYCDRTRDGETKRFYLGVWDNDGEYIRFKTLGAKKYCFDKWKKDKNTGEKKQVFEITVSGMAKKKGAKAVGSIEGFELERTFENIGRTTSWYNDSKVHTITYKGDTFTTASSIGVLDTTYTLGVTGEYLQLIKDNLK